MPKKEKKQEELDFISIASHQLRTPLTLMKGYLSMILEGEFGKVAEPKLRAALKVVYQANERLLRLADNLLEMARLEGGRLSLYKQPTDIAEMITEVITALQPKAAAKGLTLKYEKKGRLPVVKVDSMLMQQALVNLIDNALKFTSKGSVTIIVKMGDRSLELIVRDTGPGMAKKDLKQLFKKFTRFDVKHSSDEGFGLGLYIASLIVKAHKGKIAGKINSDKGLDVILIIPISEK